MFCFLNSQQVMFSREFAFCLSIIYAYILAWMHLHRASLGRNSGYHYVIKKSIKVAQYSVLGSIPPEFEHKLRRHKQIFGKMATTVVLDKNDICYNQGCNDIGVVIATKWRYYLFYLQQYISALGTVLSKSFTRAFSSTKFCRGRIHHPELQPITSLFTIFDGKGALLVGIPLIHKW